LCSIAAAYFVVQPPADETTPENQFISENIQDILLTKIATEKGVSKENVKICFIVQTENTDIFAVGAITKAGGSLLFFYDNSLRDVMSGKVDNTTTTVEEFQAFNMVAGEISPWTGNYLVPYDFTKQDNRFIFVYCDGYSTFLARWSEGMASIYLENEEIEWGPRLGLSGQ